MNHVWREGKLYNPAPDADPHTAFEELETALEDFAEEARELYLMFVGKGLWLDFKCFLSHALRKPRKTMALVGAIAHLREIWEVAVVTPDVHRKSMTEAQEAEIARLFHAKLVQFDLQLQ